MYSKEIALPYTLAETFNTAGIEVKIDYIYDGVNLGTYSVTFSSNGNGTFSIVSSSGGNPMNTNTIEQVLSVEDGKLVFKHYYKQNMTEEDWNRCGFSVTIDVTDNTYTQFRGSQQGDGTWDEFGHYVWVYDSYLTSISSNGTVVDLTEVE